MGKPEKTPHRITMTFGCAFLLWLMIFCAARAVLRFIGG